MFQGEVWWADLPPPTGSGPGFRRPDKTLLSERVGKLSKAKMELLLSGIDVVLGR